jgi:hypothetical protein
MGSVLVLGVVALAVIVVGVLAVIALARRQVKEELPPESLPTDFVAPVSSGGYSWRKTDESPEEFRARVARENEQAAKKA